MKNLGKKMKLTFCDAMATKIAGLSTSLLYFLIISLVVSCSAEDLEVSPQGTLFASNYYTEESHLNEALVATYDVLGHQMAPDLPWSPFLVVAEVLSDDAYAGGQDVGDGFDEDEFNKFKISTTNQIVYSIWKRNYNGVYRANFTIEKTEAASNLPEEARKQIIGQAKFLRAYFYFELVRFFENIALYTQVVTTENAAIPFASPQDVYAQIASDLVAAARDLPESYAGEKGRATKWAAKAMLARVYLFEKGVYGNGLQADGTNIDDAYVLGELEDIINNSGHALADDYDSIFLESGEYNDESVFEVAYAGEPVQGDWGSEQYIEGNLAAQMMGPRVSGSNIYYRGWSFAPVTFKLYNDMINDPRLDATILTEEGIEAEGSSVELNKGAYQHTGYYSAKYTTRINERGADGTPELHNKINYKVMRFADVLLMAAEIGENAVYLNRVRERVGLGAVAYSEEALFNERRMELALEGIRYFDLLRRGLELAKQELDNQGERGPLYKGDESVFQVNFNEATRGFLPIPQQEIDISNRVFVQNRGY